ncbi:MAG TPA: PrsW family intramembrane metalloprotease [Spirochaetia bacterium]|nr:PrsW family intramembrane metalloprotease [Spirochaetia bacterium]
MMLIINILLAAIPAVYLIVRFYRNDRQKPEPKSLILKTFVFGFFSVLPAALIEILISEFAPEQGTLIFRLFEAFIVAGCVEEGIKLLTVRLSVWNKAAFDEITDGIVYTVTASLGFAFFENVFYSSDSPAVLLVRGITAVPLHAIASGIMGYWIGVSRVTGEKKVLKGYLTAVMIHGLYDLFLFEGGWVSFLVIPLLVLFGLKLRSLIRRSLSEDRYAGRS